jgi:HAD superfamily hydrolase (TIGR01459 family)
MHDAGAPIARTARTLTASSFDLLDRFSTLAPRYDVVLCDVWGVVHNGLAAHPAACDALRRFRAGGGTVVLITNAPRPAEWVVRQLERLDVPRDAFDAVTTSGDVTRDVMARRAGTVFHIGPKRDISIFDGLGVSFATAETAAYAVCTGLYDDETESPETYRGLLTAMRGRQLFMLCANPDIVVERGTRLIYCAGAIADLYAAMDGDVLYAGKPYRPIYDAAFAAAARVRGAAVPPGHVLAIGDSLRTDMAGAQAVGIDGLFVTGGIHAGELDRSERPSAEALAGMFATAGVTPRAVTPRLAW